MTGREAISIVQDYQNLISKNPDAANRRAWAPNSGEELPYEGLQVVDEDDTVLYRSEKWNDPNFTKYYFYSQEFMDLAKRYGMTA
jgi:hypothetical protein